jgi:outer membrane protein assembly factor BamB
MRAARFRPHFTSTHPRPNEVNLNMHATLIFLTTILSLSPATPISAPGNTDNWPSFRGTDARGVAEGAKTPVAWNVEKRENVRFKTPIPGLGHSCPVVWQDRIFVTTAVSVDKKPSLKVGLYGDVQSADDRGIQKWTVYCLDKNSGKMLWERVAYEGAPKIQRHTKASHANSTVATDGKRVVACFGSEGLYCCDLNGKPLWKKDLGLLDSGWYVSPAAQWGFASSPILVDGKVILQADVQKDSFLAAFDAKNGNEIWRTPRADVPTWSSPTVVRDGGRTQIVVNGYKHIGGYDLATGKELWRLTGGGDIPVPTPVVADGLIFITNAHGRMAPIYAIKTSATGDITPKGEETSSAHMAWMLRREGGYMQTPLVVGDYLYVCRDNGVLGCYKAKTGERVYQERLGTGRTGFTASGVAADGKLYYTSEEGDIYVVQAGPEFKLLATNPMGEVCMATPAISGPMMYWRTQDHLVGIGQPARSARSR